MEFRDAHCVRAQQSGYLPCAAVFAGDPNDPRWESFHKAALVKIRILVEDRVSVLPCVLPNVLVACVAQADVMDMY